MITSVSELNIEEISSIIKGVTGVYEDAFQDTWVEVIGKGYNSEEDIIRVAKEKYKKYRNQSIQNKHIADIDAPIYDNPNSRELEEIIPSVPLEEMPGENDKHRFSQPNKRGSYYIDDDVAKILKSKYPTLTYSQAIRATLGLPVIMKKNDRWQAWEDEIIKKYYLQNGVARVILDLSHRTKGAISSRACRLGVGVETYTLPESFLSRQEMWSIFTIPNERLQALIKEGVIRKYKPYHKCVGYYKEDVIKFIQTQPFKYRHDKVHKDYRQYIPNWLWDWKPVKVVARETNYSLTSIFASIKQGLVPTKRYGKLVWYLRSEDIIKAKDMKRLYRQPFKVATEWSGLKHYIFQDDDGDYLRRCQPNGKYFMRTKWEKLGYKKLKFANGYPTCKKCLAILRRHRLTGKTKDPKDLIGQ